MGRSRRLIVLVSVALLLVGAALVARAGDSGDADTVGRAAGTNAKVTAPGSGSTGADPAEGATETLRQGGTGRAAPKDSGGDDDDLAPVKEVPERKSGSARLPRLSPPPKGPLLDRLPRTAARRGGLVTGYPSKVLAVPPGTRIRSSSVARAGDRLQVALVGESSHSQVALARFHRIMLGELGFHEQKVAAVGGSTGLAFRRGADSLVVTITPHGRRSSSFSVFGTLQSRR